MDRFQQAVKESEALEGAAHQLDELMKASMELAKEIASRDGDKTEAEKNFIKATTLMALKMLLISK